MAAAPPVLTPCCQSTEICFPTITAAAAIPGAPQAIGDMGATPVEEPSLAKGGAPRGSPPVLGPPVLSPSSASPGGLP